MQTKTGYFLPRRIPAVAPAMALCLCRITPLVVDRVIIHRLHLQAAAGLVRVADVI